MFSLIRRLPNEMVHSYYSVVHLAFFIKKLLLLNVTILYSVFLCLLDICHSPARQKNHSVLVCSGSSDPFVSFSFEIILPFRKLM